MENKQTAVEWLFEQFENGDMYNVEDAQRIKHQALVMEKEQIESAFTQVDLFSSDYFDGKNITSENYYNETYNNND
jgi:hypothetical protein